MSTVHVVVPTVAGHIFMDNQNALAAGYIAIVVVLISNYKVRTFIRRADLEPKPLRAILLKADPRDVLLSGWSTVIPARQENGLSDSALFHDCDAVFGIGR